MQSIKAGADIILVGHNNENGIEVFNALKESVERGIILVDKTDESVYRILKLKEKYNLKDLII